MIIQEISSTSRSLPSSPITSSKNSKKEKKEKKSKKEKKESKKNNNNNKTTDNNTNSTTKSKSIEDIPPAVDTIIEKTLSAAADDPSTKLSPSIIHIQPKIHNLSVNSINIVNESIQTTTEMMYFLFTDSILLLLPDKRLFGAKWKV